jgi:integral membrane protein
MTDISRMKYSGTSTELKQLLYSGFYEGISYLVLLLVAMPLKYMADMPMAVSIAGTLHGILFIWFVVGIVICWRKKIITFTQALICFVLSLIPYGTFFLHSYFKGKENY